MTCAEVCAQARGVGGGCVRGRDPRSAHAGADDAGDGVADRQLSRDKQLSRSRDQSLDHGLDL